MSHPRQAGKPGADRGSHSGPGHGHRLRDPFEHDYSLTHSSSHYLSSAHTYLLTYYSDSPTHVHPYLLTHTHTYPLTYSHATYSFTYLRTQYLLVHLRTGALT